MNREGDRGDLTHRKLLPALYRLYANGIALGTPRVRTAVIVMAIRLSPSME